MEKIDVGSKLIQKNICDRMYGLVFIDFTRTMMENVYWYTAYSVQDADAAEIQADYDAPVEFARSVIRYTIASEILKGDYEYLQLPGDDSWCFVNGAEQKATAANLKKQA